MQTFEAKKPCPRCGKPGLKDWKDLDAEEKMAAARMPASSEFSVEERKKHRFCIRCWYEEFARPETA
jgi:ribosomal protein S27AE